MTTDIAKLLRRIDEVMRQHPARFDSERAWSRAAGVSESYIGALRAKHAKGEAKTVKLDVVQKLADAAGVPLDWLLGGNREAYFQLTKPGVEALGTAIGIDPRHDLPGSPNLEAALEAYAWPNEVEPEDAIPVVAQVRREAFASGGRDLPQSYWMARVQRLVMERLGRAKSVPTRERVREVSADEPDPDIEAEKAARRARRTRT